MFNYDTEDTYFYYDYDRRFIAMDGRADNGRGDGLYRTSLAYITYGDVQLKNDIMACFRSFDMINRRDRKYVQGARAPFRYSEDDFSRDQFILAISALYIRGDYKEVKWIADRIPYKLSRRFRMTPTLWYWVKALASNDCNGFNARMYRFLEYTSQCAIIPVSKLARKVIGLKYESDLNSLLTIAPEVPYWHYDHDAKEWIYKTEPSSRMTLSHKMCNMHLMKRDTSKWYKAISNLIVPGYSTSLGAYMANIMGSKRLKRKLLTNVPESNYMQRILLDDNIDFEKFKLNHVAIEGWIWNENFLGTGMIYPLQPYQYSSNNMSFDIIEYLYYVKEEETI